MENQMDRQFYDEMLLKVKECKPIAIFIGTVNNLDDHYMNVPHKMPVETFISLYCINNEVVGIIQLYNIQGKSCSIDTHALKIEAARVNCIPLIDNKIIQEQAIIINPIICKTLTDDNEFKAKINLVPYKTNDQNSYSGIDCTLFVNKDRKLTSGIFEISKKLFDEWVLITRDYAFLSNYGMEEYKDYAPNRKKLLEKDLELKELLIEKTKLEIEKTKLEIEEKKKKIEKMNLPHF